MVNIVYQFGFNNQFATEAKPGALPLGQNSPQQTFQGLFPEQISGSSFTAKRENNLRTWTYRLQPSVLESEYTPYSSCNDFLTPTKHKEFFTATPNPLRWDPLPPPTSKQDFIHGLTSWAGHGNPNDLNGACIHLYACNQDMVNSFFQNTDAEILIIPQQGELIIHTEMGSLQLAAKEIAVIPRGIKFQVNLQQDYAAGWFVENFGLALRLPELGPIGANGLANPRDFAYPTAKFWQETGDFTLITKYQGSFWQIKLEHHPLNVVAWHGNLAPYKYDLTKFNTIGSISFDHPDPSIFTVLTSPSPIPGYANLDFVIFPERWLVAEHTFRPPYYHRNIMSEFMGLIHGEYDAKPQGFIPGGSSLHNKFTPHGPDTNSYINALEKDLTPEKLSDTMAFMCESTNPWEVTATAMKSSSRQKNYTSCWQGLSTIK